MPEVEHRNEAKQRNEKEFLVLEIPFLDLENSVAGYKEVQKSVEKLVAFHTSQQVEDELTSLGDIMVNDSTLAL